VWLEEKRAGIKEEFRGRINSVSGEKFGWRLKMSRADEWVPRVSERRRERGYRFGEKVSGPWVDSVTGPNRSLRPFSIFILFSSFSFSVFLFPLYLSQKCFKSIQTTFRNFLKINAMI
jgi:hypothetical protein